MTEGGKNENEKKQGLNGKQQKRADEEEQSVLPR